VGNGEWKVVGGNKRSERFSRKEGRIFTETGKEGMSNCRYLKKCYVHDETCTNRLLQSDMDMLMKYAVQYPSYKLVGKLELWEGKDCEYWRYYRVRINLQCVGKDLWIRVVTTGNRFAFDWEYFSNDW